MSYELRVMSYINNSHPLVVIFGRTNVGKSTLFNCLVGKRRALVSKIEGTTRDSNIGEVEWRGKKFKLVDTGGILDLKYLLTKKGLASDIETKVQKQAASYLKKANLILFLVDKKTGLLPQDRQMALFLKKTLAGKNNIILVVNKVGGQKERKDLSEFYQLGLGEFCPVSALTGSGTGDLLDLIIQKLKSLQPISVEKENLKSKIENLKSLNVCILGQPNVGKSNLLNSVLGEERVIVSSIPHTTREPQDTFVEYKNHFIKLVDTAGISRKGLRHDYDKKIFLEKKGIAMSLNALKKADIALLLLDISRPITHQDLKIAEEIIERKKSLIMVANKWDLIAERDTKKFTNYIYRLLPFLHWVPIQFTSAHTGEKIKKILDLVLAIGEQREKEISENDLAAFIKKIVKLHKPSKGKGVKHPRLRSLKQIGINPPKFELTIGKNEDLHYSYVKFIENRLREKFNFIGTPISIKIVKS